MSQEKAQLIAPIDSSFTVDGVTVSGVITATTFDGTITGVADSITQGKNLNVGVVTALSFAGNLTGNAGGLIGSPNTVAGVVTATSFVGGLTGNITGDVIGHATGVGASIKQGVNLNVGIATASKWYGDGSGLTGVGATSYIAQEVTASSAETIIDLTYGNLVYLSQSSDTTVGFASTAATQEVTIVRNTNSSNTITWPDRIKWSGGSSPTLFDNSTAGAFQVFRFLSVDSGLSYNGWEEMENNGPYNSLFSWGQGSYGATGLNETTAYSSPMQVGTDTDWTHVYQGVEGNLSTFFGKSAGTLWSAGYNSGGQMGVNDTIRRSSPTQIPGTTWSTSAVIGRFTPIIPKTDGTLWSWGRNNHGQLGLNQTSNLELSSPTQIGTDTTWSSVAGLGGRVLALKTNGTLWSWGYNEYGQTGSNDRTNRSSPNQVGTDTTWAKLPVSGSESGNSGSAAIKTDGTLWVWGNQWFYGQLGLNESGAPSRKSSPTQVPGTTWSNVAAGRKSTMATKTDGTLWVMGTNEFGTLGQNEGPGSTAGALSSPTQIPGTTWDGTQMRVPSSGEGMMAMKTDGTLWAWGNGGGWMGLNSEANLSSPTQVPGTWASIGGGTAITALQSSTNISS